MTGWATDKELREEHVPLKARVEYLSIERGKNAVATALVEKAETILGEDPDVQPVDIGAVSAGPAPAQQRGSRGLAKRSNEHRRPE